MSQLLSGTHLGRYEVGSQLGAGGMGEVYLAQDTSDLERTVPIKILPAALASDQQRMQRFIWCDAWASSPEPVMKRKND